MVMKIKYNYVYGILEGMTPTRTLSRQSTYKGESLKKLPPEEYDKFIEEANHSTSALAKIIHLSNRITQSATLTGLSDDRNFSF